MKDLKESEFKEYFEEYSGKTLRHSNTLVTIRPPRRYQKKISITKKTLMFIGQILNPIREAYNASFDSVLKATNSILDETSDWLSKQKNSVTSAIRQVDYETRIMSLIYIASILLLLVATFKQQTHF